jgi:glucose-1-phosphate adenylyltransferase
VIAPGATVAGEVERSVVGRGALVEKGAVVRGAVLLPGSIVRAGARVERAILDDNVEVRGTVGEPDGEIALVGMGAVVGEDVRLGGGARFPDED